MITRREFFGAAIAATATTGFSLAPPRSMNPSAGSREFSKLFTAANRNSELSIQCTLTPRAAQRPVEIETLDSAQIVHCWADLFQHWLNADKYKFFFIDLPLPLSINQLTSSNYQAMIERLDIVHWTPPPLANQTVPNAYVTVSIPRSMYQVGSPQRSEQYCVALDGIDATVPEVAAHVCSAGFAAGLACRLTLQHLLQDASGLPVFGVRPSQKAKLQSGTIITRGAEDWNTFVERITRDAPFEAAGIFHGWQAGSELSLLAGSDVKIRNAVWSLLKSRFSWDEIGELCGYAFNYITGYLRCQAVLAKFEKTRQPFTSANVVAAMREDDNIIEVGKVLSDLYGKLLEQLINVYSTNQTAGRKFEKLLVGFQRGQLRASSVVFQQALSLGYGIGYRDGFQDGYARGYADGYAAGYSAGEDNSSFSFGGFFKAIGDVASIVGSVAEIVAYFA